MFILLYLWCISSFIFVFFLFAPIPYESGLSSLSTFLAGKLSLGNAHVFPSSNSSQASFSGTTHLLSTTCLASLDGCLGGTLNWIYSKLHSSCYSPKLASPLENLCLKLEMSWFCFFLSWYPYVQSVFLGALPWCPVSTFLLRDSYLKFYKRPLTGFPSPSLLPLQSSLDESS